MTDRTKTENLTEAVLDNVQGGGYWGGAICKNSYSSVKQAGGEGMVLSSESETTYLKGMPGAKGVAKTGGGSDI